MVVERAREPGPSSIQLNEHSVIDGVVVDLQGFVNLGRLRMKQRRVACHSS